MEEILHQLINILCLQGFIHVRWCRISSINSISIPWRVASVHWSLTRITSCLIQASKTTPSTVVFATSIPGKNIKADILPLDHGGDIIKKTNTHLHTIHVHIWYIYNYIYKYKFLVSSSALHKPSRRNGTFSPILSCVKSASQSLQLSHVNFNIHCVESGRLEIAGVPCKSTLTWYARKVRTLWT